jgi:hypothetical protein
MIPVTWTHPVVVPISFISSIPTTNNHGLPNVITVPQSTGHVIISYENVPTSVPDVVI